MKIIKELRTPRNAGDVAVALRLFLIDGLRLNPAGSSDARGTDIEFQLPNGREISIRVKDSATGDAART